jgi:hypothetical protein
MVRWYPVALPVPGGACPAPTSQAERAISVDIVDRVEKREAHSILQELLDELRVRPYSELAKLIGDSQQRKITR